jgi:hypothetical protein
VLLAKEAINCDTPLLIVNCQQYIEWDAKEFYQTCIKSKADGVIATFTSSHPRYSYVSQGKDGNINEVAEKKTISQNASCGVYFWKRGADFVKYAEGLTGGSAASECSVIMAYKGAINDGLVIETFKCSHSWQLKV